MKEVTSSLIHSTDIKEKQDSVLTAMCQKFDLDKFLKKHKISKTVHKEINKPNCNK
jgi:hypothetical protein